MSYTSGNDFNILQATDISIVGAGAGNDTYILSNGLLAAGQLVTISDAQGTNTLQLVGGLTITSSLVSNDAVLLTLSNGAKVTVLGASSFTFNVGGNATMGVAGTNQTYSTFATTTLGAASVPAAGAAAVAGTPNVTVVGGGGAAAGQTFELTSSVATPDAPVLTAGSDTMTGAAGTLQSTDRLIDTSVTDTDVLNASVSGYTGAAVTPTVINVENLNITGLYTATGFDLTNTVGGKTLTLATGIAGGTATVTDAALSKIGTIASGANVTTLNVTALAAGTGGNLVINSGSTAVTSVTGGLGNDTFTITAPAASTVHLDDGGTTTGDASTVNFSGGLNSLGMTRTGVIEKLTLNSNTAANTATLLTTLKLAGVASGDKIVIGGTQALTISGDLDALSSAALGTNVVVEKATGAGVVTFDATAATATTAFANRAAIDVIKLGVTTTALTVNQGTTLKLGATMTAAAFDVADGTATALAAGSGTLKLDILTGTQTSITTGAAVGTLNLTANTANVSIATLDTNTIATTVDTVSISGSKNVTIGGTAWTHTAGDVISASTLTGILNVPATGTGTVDSIIIGGINNDVVTFGALTATTSVARGGLGDDTLTAPTATSTSKVSLYGDEGNDVITGGIGSDVLNGGDGNDTITRGATGANTGADTMTGGAGTDKFVLMSLSTAAAAQVSSITDFVAGTDKIALAAANVTASTVLKNVSTTISASNQALVDATTDVIAAGLNVATNMAAYSGATYTAAANDVIVFGYKGDTYAYINADTTATVTTTDFLVKITGVTGTLTVSDFLVA